MAFSANRPGRPSAAPSIEFGRLTAAHDAGAAVVVASRSADHVDRASFEWPLNPAGFPVRRRLHGAASPRSRYHRLAEATIAMPASIIDIPTMSQRSIFSPVTQAETVSPTTGTASIALEVVIAERRRLASTTAQ